MVDLEKMAAQYVSDAQYYRRCEACYARYRL